MDAPPRRAPSYHHRARNGVVPLGSLFVVLLAVLFSLLFIFSISLAFVGVADQNFFFRELEALAKTGNGIVLLGESVDVDVDEPQVSIRWSLVACGSDYMLPDSPPIHGSKSCGMPNMALEVFVDSQKAPVATYDPTSIPVDLRTGQRKIIQNLLQFDSDHVLDVHTTRLYPFDTYSLSTDVRVALPPSTTTNTTDPSDSDEDTPTIPFLGISIVDEAITFSIDTFDTPTSEGPLVNTPNAKANATPDPTPSRYIELLIRRPAASRIYALLLFGINWLLSHFNFGVVLMATCRGRLKRAGYGASASVVGDGAKGDQETNGRMAAVRKVLEQRRARAAAARVAAKTGDDSDEKPEKTVSSAATPPPTPVPVYHRSSTSKDSLKLLAGVLAIILVIPQLRNAMPDAPGFDGVLLDVIGFFPQMALAGASAIFLLLITVKRELDHSGPSTAAAFQSRPSNGDAEKMGGDDEYGFKLPSAFMSFGIPRGFHSRQLTRH